MFKDDEEKQFVITFLVQSIAVMEKPRETLIAPILDSGIPEKIIGNSFQEWVTQAVFHCVADGWNNTPTRLSALLWPFKSANKKISDLIDRLQVKPPDSADPLNQTILNDGTLFVNRVGLRGHLRRLATPAANLKPILLVSGTAKSGKSYSSRYINHFANVKLAANQSIVTCPIEFDPDMAVDMGPEYLAKKLVNLASGKMPGAIPYSHTNKKLIIEELVAWVLSEAFNTKWEQIWFVLDNFKGEKLLPETRDFLVSLSTQITSGVFQQKCRLILIAFDQQQLTVDDTKFEEDSITKYKQAEIDASVNEIKKLAPVLLEDQWITDFIFNNLPQDENNLSELNSRLRKFIYAVVQIKKIAENVPGLDYKEVLRKMMTDLPAGDEGMALLKNKIKDFSELV
jgi:hypothetical protein